jgi:cytidylate kinase
MAGYKYRNVTISGLPGNGSTTLLKNLKIALESEHWKGFSGGEFMRDYAIKKGLFDPKTNKFHHSATVYSEEFDREVDYGMREKLQKEEKWILESWLSGFMAQQVPDVFKVLLICSDDAVRIDRIVNRDKVSIQEAKEHINERKDKNLKKWQKMYAKEWNDWVVKPGTLKPGSPIDFWVPELYDVVIDTYSSSREETVEKVIQAIRKS